MTEELENIIHDIALEVLIEVLNDKMVLTDYGMVLNEKNEEVYRTHFNLEINKISDTVARKCRESDNPVGSRRNNDMVRLRLIAMDLLRLDK